MSSQVEKRIEELTQTVDQLTHRIKDISEKVESYTREHPMVAVGAAFLIGLLIGVVLGAASKR